LPRDFSHKIDKLTGSECFYDIQLSASPFQVVSCPLASEKPIDKYSDTRIYMANFVCGIFGFFCGFCPGRIRPEAEIGDLPFAAGKSAFSNSAHIMSALGR
jgi:hypothetical protein